MRKSHLYFAILVAVSIFALPILGVLAVEPSDSVPSGLSPCEMQHKVKGCSANMANPEVPGGLTQCGQKQGADSCNIEACCFLDMIYTVADWIFVILLVISGIFIIWGGIEFVTSGGVPEKITSGRNKLIWALVGVVIAFVARGLVVLITQIIQK